jgi:hypothetical protein
MPQRMRTGYISFSGQVIDALAVERISPASGG